METELIWSLLFVAGIVTGVYASVVGGGALVLVPIFTLLGTPIITAVGTMRASAMVQEFVSMLMFWKKGLIDWRPSLWVALTTMIGGVIGANIIFNVDTRTLSYVIAVLMLVLLVILPRLGKGRDVQQKYPSKIRHWLALGGVGLVLGVYGGFYGAGFGTLLIFMFAFLGGWSIIISAGNARVVGFFMSLAATFVFYQHQAIDWNLFIPMNIGLIIGSVIGVNFAAKFGSRWVVVLLVLVVIASVIKLVLYPG